MGIQNFNLAKYVRGYLSPLLRKPRLLAYVRALISPHQAWRDQRTQTIYPDLERRARYNAQVARFEAALNIIFGQTVTPTYRGIYLDESSVRKRTYLFNMVEELPLYLYNANEGQPVYLYNNREYLPLADFTVNVPQALYATQLPRIRATVDRYKLAGTTYAVLPY
jgi:hypothetical protein